jgi:hypothetical protein
MSGLWIAHALSEWCRTRGSVAARMVDPEPVFGRENHAVAPPRFMS